MKTRREVFKFLLAAPVVGYSWAGQRVVNRLFNWFKYGASAFPTPCAVGSAIPDVDPRFAWLEPPVSPMVSLLNRGVQIDTGYVEIHYAPDGDDLQEGAFE